MCTRQIGDTITTQDPNGSFTRCWVPEVARLLQQNKYVQNT